MEYISGTSRCGRCSQFFRCWISSRWYLSYTCSCWWCVLYWQYWYQYIVFFFLFTLIVMSFFVSLSFVSKFVPTIRDSNKAVVPKSVIADGNQNKLIAWVEWIVSSCFALTYPFTLPSSSLLFLLLFYICACTIRTNPYSYPHQT